MFEDCQLAVKVETKDACTRGHYAPATEYVNHVDRSHVNLVEAFKHMKLDVEEPLQNGGLDHEVCFCIDIKISTQLREVIMIGWMESENTYLSTPTLWKVYSSIKTIALKSRSIFNIHMCSNGRWGKPTGNGSDTGVATMPKSNRKNGDEDGDDVEQNKLMENSMCDYDSLISMCLMEN
nr:coatomer beta' subunit [Tanacetum cinerariifolium]